MSEFFCILGYSAEGDGEVYVSAIETDLSVTVRFFVIKGFSIDEPLYENEKLLCNSRFGITILEAAKKKPNL